MRTLAIETSAGRGGVALVERGQLACALGFLHPQQRAEELLPTIARALDRAGWERTTLDRIGVAVGPGSFTGLRIGIACAHGLALGLDIPLVGVTSLRAMARAVPDSVRGTRVALLDARRGEVFAAAHQAGPGAPELMAPEALPAASAKETLEARWGRTVVWIGSGAPLAGATSTHPAPETEEPSAYAIGLLAEELVPSEHPPMPVYVRDAGATLPRPR